MANRDPLAAELHEVAACAEKAARGHPVGTSDLRLQIDRVLPFLSPGSPVLERNSAAWQGRAIELARDLAVAVQSLQPGGDWHSQDPGLARAGYERLASQARWLAQNLTIQQIGFTLSIWDVGSEE